MANLFLSDAELDDVLEDLEDFSYSGSDEYFPSSSSVFVMMIMLDSQIIGTTADSSTMNIIRSSNIVSNNVYKILANTSGNVLFCPISSNILLSLVSLAAKGNTSEELKTSLHLGSDEEIKTGYQNILRGFRDNTLKLATRLYPKDGIRLNLEFLATAHRYFHTEVQKIDYNRPMYAARVINTFVEFKTNNKIHEVVKPGSLSSDTNIVLVNAAYFKNNWKNRFYKTFESDFHIGENDTVKSIMMEDTNDYNFTTSASMNAKVLQIPFQNAHYSMVFILPNEVDDLDAAEAELYSTNIDELISNLTKIQVQVQIPKFKIESNINLTPVLESLGIRTIFSKDADLSGISTDTKLAVSQALQKTFIDVNENGVEAAATTVSIHVKKVKPLRQPSEKFTADHPFIFAIMRGNLVLLQGRLSKI